MKSSRTLWIVLATAAVVSLTIAYNFYFGGRVVVADRQAHVFSTEYQAAYEAALNRVPASPIASIEIGEPVAVIWDTYGKDYWACYVRTSKGVRGWALCTALKKVA